MVYKLGIVAGGVGRVIQKPSRPADVNNHYIVGSGVGAKSRSVRQSLKKRANNNAKGLPCCLENNTPGVNRPNNKIFKML